MIGHIYINIYWGYIRIMEQKMKTTRVPSGRGKGSYRCKLGVREC